MHMHMHMHIHTHMHMHVHMNVPHTYHFFANAVSFYNLKYGFKSHLAPATRHSPHTLALFPCSL